MANHETNITSSGVEALIERLKKQGITAGQEKAESIVLDAQKRAEWIIHEAALEADLLVKNAHDDSEAVQRAGHDALKLAARDAYLKLRDSLTVSFRREVLRIVSKKMAEKKFLEKLILTLAGQVREKTCIDHVNHLVFQLPRDNIENDKGRKQHAEEYQEDALSHFAAELASGMLCKGVHLEFSDALESGLLLKLTDDNIEIDFTDKAVATLLLEHLQPRFHDLLEGVVK